MQEEMKNKMEKMKGKVKAGSWWFISGAIIAMIIGFTWGGWITAATSQELSDKAVLASHTAICVAQFTEDPVYQKNLNEFEGIDSWKRPDLIEKGGWGKMPGQEEASYSVCRACAAGIEDLIKK